MKEAEKMGDKRVVSIRLYRYNIGQGMNVSWLYPEMPVVSNEIEARKITI